MTYELRKNKISAVCNTSGRNFKAQMKTAETCKFACIIGSEELADGTVAVKNLSDSSQINISMTEAANYLLSACSKN